MALLRLVIVFSLVFMIFGRRDAEAASGNMAVSAYIPSWGYCVVNSTQNIDFGNLNPMNPENVQATGGVTVTCLGWDNNFTVGVTQVTPSPLHLTSGSNSIPYTLELPTSATTRLRIIGTIAIPVKARIRGVDYMLAKAGSYTNTVTVQINP